MNKLILIIVVAIITFFTGCTGGGPNIGIQNGYQLETVVEGKLPAGQSGYTQFIYEDYNILLADKKKELANKLASSQETQSELRAIPRGGIGIIRIARDTIDAANTRFFEYAIEENGKIIYRKKGKFNIPNTPSSGDGINWTNTDIITFPKAVRNTMTVYVIDNLNKIRAKYIITKSKK